MTEDGDRDKKSSAGSHRKRATSPKRNLWLGYGDVSMLRVQVAKRDVVRHSRIASSNLARIAFDWVERKLLGKALLLGATKPRKLERFDSKILRCTPSIPFVVPSATGIPVNLAGSAWLGARSQ